MTGDDQITKAHKYKTYARDPDEYLKQSLNRLAIFADINRIKSPEECMLALSKVKNSLFFTGQYEVLRNYAIGK